MRYTVKEIAPTKALPEYKFAVLDTKRVVYVRYCTSREQAERFANDANSKGVRKA